MYSRVIGHSSRGRLGIIFKSSAPFVQKKRGLESARGIAVTLRITATDSLSTYIWHVALRKIRTWREPVPRTQCTWKAASGNIIPFSNPACKALSCVRETAFDKSTQHYFNLWTKWEMCAIQRVWKQTPTPQLPRVPHNDLWVQHLAEINTYTTPFGSYFTAAASPIIIGLIRHFSGASYSNTKVR